MPDVVTVSIISGIVSVTPIFIKLIWDISQIRRENIKAYRFVCIYLIAQAHYIGMRQKMIDRHVFMSLSSMYDAFNAGGKETYVTSLMDDIRKLPIVDVEFGEESKDAKTEQAV